MLRDLRTTLKRYTKKSTVIVYSRQIAKWDSSQITIYAEIKRKRQSLFNIVASKHNIVTTNQIRAKKQKKDENKMLKTRRDVDAINTKLIYTKAKIEKKRLRLWNDLFRDFKKIVIARNKCLRLKKTWFDSI